MRAWVCRWIRQWVSRLRRRKRRSLNRIISHRLQPRKQWSVTNLPTLLYQRYQRSRRWIKRKQRRCRKSIALTLNPNGLKICQSISWNYSLYIIGLPTRSLLSWVRWPRPFCKIWASSWRRSQRQRRGNQTACSSWRKKKKSWKWRTMVSTKVKSNSKTFIWTTYPRMKKTLQGETELKNQTRRRRGTDGSATANKYMRAYTSSIRSSRR